MYLVQPSDTLWSIAKRYYGSGARYPIIFRANQGRLKDPDFIIDCQRIYLPKWRRSSFLDDSLAASPDAADLLVPVRAVEGPLEGHTGPT